MDNGRLRVLLIEDDENDYLLTCELLKGVESPRFEVEWATTFEGGLEAIGRGGYDVALVDYRLGAHDGLELLREAVASGCRIPIIMLTGLDNRETDVQAMEAGAADFLDKNQLSTRLLERSIRYAIERKRAEDTLAAERNLLRTLIDSIPDYIFVKDTQSRFVMANNAVLAAGGLTGNEQLAGKTDFDFLPADIAQPFYDDEQQVVASGIALLNKEEASVDLQTGERLWFSTTKVPLRDSQSNITGLLGISRNITENKQVEEALQKSEESHRLLTENAQDIIYRYRLAPIRGFEYVSPAATALIGYTPEEHYADPDLGFKLVYPEDRELLQQVSEGINLIQTLTLRWIRKDNQVVWMEQRNVPIYDEAGNLVALEGIARDVTKRKHAEDKFHALLESAPDAMVIVNQQGTIELVNSQAEKLFGYIPDELLGQAIEMLIPEPFRSRHPAQREGYSADPHVRGMGVGLELYALRKDGSQFPVEISLSPIETEEGILIASAVRDITDRKLAEKRALELSIEREKVRLLTEFIQYSAHDLRTPLTSMSMALHIAQRTDDAQKRNEKLDAIADEILKMATIIQQWHLLTRLESGLPLDMESISLDNIVQGTPSHIQRIIKEKRLSFRLPPESHILITGDVELLRDAFYNLLHNAVLYTPQGGSITIDTYAQDQWGVIEVSDTGVGIENAKLGTIFDFFTKINAARTSDGSGAGLGLPIVKKIMDIHNGKVTVTSNPGQGSNFCLMLPLADRLEANPIEKPSW